MEAVSVNQANVVPINMAQQRTSAAMLATNDIFVVDFFIFFSPLLFFIWRFFLYTAAANAN